MSRFSRNLSFARPSRFYAGHHAGRPAWHASPLFAAAVAGAVAAGILVTQMLFRAGPAPIPETGASARIMPPLAGRYAVEVLRVIDGDTFEARVHVWPGLELATRVRLRSIDAPELKARCAAERAGAEAARDALRDILDERDVSIWSIGPDKYFGRIVAEVSTRRTANVSAALLDKGVVRAYAGGHRDGWCDRKYSG